MSENIYFKHFKTYIIIIIYSHFFCPFLIGPHYQAFQKAQELGLNVTLHAGEVGDLTNIVKAVEQYGASRIGHGYHIVKDVKLMEYLREKDIHFEVCPTSSVSNEKMKELKTIYYILSFYQ